MKSFQPLRPRVVVDNRTDSLFVRLSPDVVAELISTAWVDVADRPQQSLRRDHGWYLEKKNVNFLPLQLDFDGKVCLCASFNGGLLEQSTNTIQIPQGLLSGVDDTPLTSVHVRPLAKVLHASRIQVDPLTTADWELLQVHAEEFERGAILKQVSVVTSGQQLKFRIQNDFIHVMVQEIRTALDDSPWPAYSDDGEIETPQAVMLVNDTEMVVTPKPRPPSKSVYGWSVPLQVVPCTDDKNAAALEFSDRLLSKRLDVLPASMVVHPDTWDSTFGDWARVCEDGNKDNFLLARIETSQDIPTEQAALHPWMRLQLGLALYWSKVRICPAPAPMVASLQDVTFKKVNFQNDSTTKLWRIPNLRAYLANLEKEPCQPCTGCSFPIGSVLALPNCATDNYVRITWKSSLQISEDAVVMISPSDIASLQGSEELPMEEETFNFPSTDRQLEMVPAPILPTTIEFARSICDNIQKKSSSMCILSGAIGSGKTHTALVVASIARESENYAVLYLDCKKLQEGSNTLAEILVEFDDIFGKAVKAGKCFLVLDDMDRLAPNFLDGDEGDQGSKVQMANPVAIEQAKLIADRVIQLVASVNTLKSMVSVIMTCASPNSLHMSLLSESSSFNVADLDAGERLELLSRMVWMGGSDVELPHRKFSDQMEGFRARDLEKVAARVRHAFLPHGVPTEWNDALRLALQDFLPVSALSVDKSRSKATLDWSQVGGLFDVKQKLESTLLHPTKYRAIYQQAKVRLPRGVLLFGPTGCGKSAIVPALAAECNFSLVSCKGPEILDKYIGASEAKVRELFKQAAAVAPSILFLDELDALAPRRGSDHTGVTDRVVNQLLTFLDGVEDNSSAVVYIIGATSRPDKVDPALLRPGRLEQHLYLGPPNIDAEWVDLLRKVSTGWSLSGPCRSYLASEAGALGVLREAKQNPLFCPADMKAALDTAQLKAVHRTLKTTRAEDVENVEIEVEDLKMAFMETKPCLNADDGKTLDAIYDRYRSSSKSKKAILPTSLKTTLK